MEGEVDMDQIKIGKLIAKQRKEKGLTQQELGDKVGVGYRAVSKWETGQTMPDISIINELSKNLGITTDELLNGELNKPKSSTSKSNKKYLLLLIPIIIIGIVITTIIRQNNKVYEYDLKSANTDDYQVEGKLTIKDNMLTIQINKINFINYDFKQTTIKNYEYKILSNEKVLFGVGYSDVSEIISQEMEISKFQKTFKAEYHDKLPFSKDIITNNNLILEFRFIDINDNQINKKIEIILIPTNNDKSTK